MCLDVYGFVLFSHKCEWFTIFGSTIVGVRTGSSVSWKSDFKLNYVWDLFTWTLVRFSSRVVCGENGTGVVLTVYSHGERGK